MNRASSQPPTDPVRTHRRLVRLGYALLATGPLLALAHLVTDARSTDSPWWTYTIASYDITVIIVIIATALILRTPPHTTTGISETQPGP